MAVAKQSSSAAKIPNHIAEPAIGAPYSDWIWYVSQRNAPGAMSAIALIVSPVRPSVARLGVWPPGAALASCAMVDLPLAWLVLYGPTGYGVFRPVLLFAKPVLLLASILAITR